MPGGGSHPLSPDPESQPPEVCSGCSDESGFVRPSGKGSEKEDALLRGGSKSLILRLAVFALIVGAVGAEAGWVAASGGKIPSGAYKAGVEHPPGSQTLYACRAKFKNGTHPGKVRSAFRGCNIGWGGGEHTVASYEVLVQ